MGLKDFLVLFLMAMTSFKFENGGDNRTKGLLSTRQTKAGKVGGFGKPFCCWGSKPEHELRFCSTTAVHLPFNVCSASVATASISFQLTILEEFFFMRHFFSFRKMCTYGGVGGAIAAAIGAIGDTILTPLLWSDPEQEWRLDTEEHACEEEQSKAELPGADPSSQDQL